MKLIEAIEKLKKSVGIPPSIAEIMGAEKKEVWLNNVDSILLILIFKFHLSAVLLSLPWLFYSIYSPNCSVRKQLYFAAIEKIANEAFDDQCTGANPRYPLIKDLSQVINSQWCET